MSRLFTFLFLLLLTGLSGQLVQAQVTQSATKVVRAEADCVLFLCGAVRNASQAVDNNPATGAEVIPPLALGGALLRLSFSQQVPANTTLKLMLASDGGILGAALLDQVSINTYLGNDTKPVQSLRLRSLLSAELLGQSMATVQVPITQAINQVEVEVNGVANVSFGVRVFEAYAATATAAPLPVTLTRFTAQPEATGVRLQWQTAAEINNRGFVVERSANGAEFEAVAEIAGAGNTEQSRRYEYLDTRPAPYYRLRQLDLDGRSTYSSVQQVVLPGITQAAAYPNPATTEVRVQAPLNTAFTLLNSQGQVVRQGRQENLETIVSLAELPAGIYLLRTAVGTVRVQKQ